VDSILTIGVLRFLYVVVCFVDEDFFSEQSI